MRAKERRGGLKRGEAMRREERRGGLKRERENKEVMGTKVSQTAMLRRHFNRSFHVVIRR